jgi:hypothetical protein
MSVYLGKQRQHVTAQITATHGTVLQFEELRDWVTKFLWIITSHRLLCLICFNVKWARVEQFAMTGVECHDIGLKPLHMKMRKTAIDTFLLNSEGSPGIPYSPSGVLGSYSSRRLLVP